MTIDTLSVTHSPESAQAAQAAAQQQNASEQAAPKWGSTARVVGDTVRAPVTDGKETRAVDGFAKVSSTDSLNNDPGKGGIIATARSPLGTPRSGSSINPDKDIVTLPGGMQTTVRAAEAAGFLVQTGNGEWADAGSTSSSTGNSATPKQEGEQSQDQQPKQEQQDNSGIHEVEPLDTASEAILTELTSKASNVELVAGARDMIETGAVSEDTLRAVATQLGVTPEEVAGRASALHEAFSRQAHESVGTGAEAVFAWARENMPKELRAAVDLQVLQGTTSGYKSILARHIETLADINPAAILNSPDAAARGVQQERDGSITVNIEGVGRVGWRAAVRAGLIKPHYFK